MQIDRWALPPAVAIAVFLTMAIVPPGGQLARGVRVEVAGAPAPSRPLLVRLAIEDAGTPRWRAPAVARVALRDARGARTEGAVQPRLREVPYRFAVVSPQGAGPYTLEVSADGFTARVPVSPGPGSRAPAPSRDAMIPAAAPLPEGEHGIDVVVEGGPMVPEVPAVVLVRASDGAGRGLSFVPDDPALEVPTRRTTLDACGVAIVDATVRGLDAHAVITVDGAPPRVANRRLPVAAGWLDVHAAGPDAAEFTTAVGGRAVHVVAGDRVGATFWTTARLDDPAEAAARVTVPVPAGSAWVLAALSPAFEQASGLWLADPGLPGTCALTPLGVRFARARAPLPSAPSVRLAYDGASEAAAARDARKERARGVALLLAGLSFLVLMFLILTAGLARDPQGLRHVSHAPRQRIAVALGGVALIALSGVVLFVVYALRS